MKKLITLFVAVVAFVTVASAQDFSRDIVGTFANDTIVATDEVKVWEKQTMTFSINGIHTNETFMNIEIVDLNDEDDELSSITFNMTMSGNYAVNQNILTIKYDLDNFTIDGIAATGVFKEMMDNDMVLPMMRQQLIEQNYTRNEFQIVMPNNNNTLELTWLRRDLDGEVTNILKRVK